MEVRGLCAICGLPAKLYTCSSCGKTICSQCMGHKQHICNRCVSGRTGIIPVSENSRILK
ncbi:hypothetical protein [Methanosarcina sp.]|uniref:hypothetical protein n=1 Tax=Methanosarcina sp. TaxID=2213 RepID=UPI003C77C245